MLETRHAGKETTADESNGFFRDSIMILDLASLKYLYKQRTAIYKDTVSALI